MLVVVAEHLIQVQLLPLVALALEEMEAQQLQPLRLVVWLQLVVVVVVPEMLLVPLDRVVLLLLNGPKVSHKYFYFKGD
jgi:hypothetical protein